MDIHQLDRKIFNEYKKLLSYEDYLNFRNRYKDFIFINYYLKPIFDKGNQINIVV